MPSQFFHLPHGGTEKLPKFAGLKYTNMDYVSCIGFMAATLKTVSFVPQAVKIFRTRQTKDISLWMYVAFVIGVTLWLVYGILGRQWPIILANIVTLTLVIPILIFKIIYK